MPTRKSRGQILLEPLAYDVEQTAAVVGVGREAIEAAMNDPDVEHRLGHFRIGRRIVIPKASLEAWLNRQVSRETNAWLRQHDPGFDAYMRKREEEEAARKRKPE
jgi:hypothetical protein